MRGKVMWNWYFVSVGKGRAIDVRSDDFIKLATSGLFKRKPGTSGSGFAGDMAIGQENNSVAVSDDIISEDTFNSLMKVDFGISLLVEFEYSDGIGKKIKNASCLGHLAAGASSILDAADCAKYKSHYLYAPQPQ